VLLLHRRHLRHLGRPNDVLTVAPELDIVDSHMHLWDLSRISYPWLTPPLRAGVTGDVSSIARTYLLDDYLRDVAAHESRLRVGKIVHVEAGASPADSLAETRWLQGIADARGFPQAIVAHAALEKPDAAGLLAQHAAHPNVRGIRQILNWHADPAKTYTPRDLLTDEAWHRGFALLARHGLSFDLQIYPAQMPAAARLAARHPDTAIILNHAGMPVDKDAAGIEAWRTGMRALAARPNVAVKISGLAMLDWHWTCDSLKPFVLETLEIFGADRVMIASNFPTDRPFGTLAGFYDAYRALLAGASEEERARLFARNAERIYRIQ
jgi:predicted TIM-barrel fold metal-dependent hydrolase